MIKDKITQRQLLALGFVCLSSPAIRLLPSSAAAVGGRSAWISVIIGAIPAILYMYILCSFMEKRDEGEGMADMIVRCVGRPAGIVVSASFLIWIVLYGGFILRVSSERLMATIFDNGSLFTISLVTVSASFVAGSGRVKSLVRTGEIMFIIIAAVLWTTVFLAAGDLDIRNVWPPEFDNISGIFLGAGPTVDIATGFFYLTFLAGFAKKKKDEKTLGMRWSAYLTLAMLGITFCTIGVVSAPVISNMQSPFFVMIRNISVFGIIERIESVIIAVWVFADFLFLAALVKISGMLCEKLTGRMRGRSVFIICAAAMFAVSFLISASGFELNVISKTLVPYINVSLTVGVFMIIYVIGKMRKKL